MISFSPDLLRLIEADPGGVALVAADSADHLVLAANRHYLSMLGAARERIIGAKLTDCLARVLDTPSANALVETLAGLSFARAPAESMFLSNGARRFQSHNAPVLDENGQLLYIAHHLYELSDARRHDSSDPSSNHLDGSETAYLRQVIEGSPYAVAMFDTDMRYLYASKRWRLAHEINLSSTALRGKSHYDLFRDIPAHWRDVHRRALAGEVVREESESVLREDGTVQWWRWEVRPWFGLDRQVHGIVIYSEDVSAAKRTHVDLKHSSVKDLPPKMALRTAPAHDGSAVNDRKQADQFLRASEARFRGTFDNAAVGIAHVGLDGQWLRVNDKLCSITGYSREELLTLTTQEITYPEDLVNDSRVREQMLAGAMQTLSAERRYIRRDLSLIWINVTVSLMRTVDGRPDYFIAFVEDIAARKAASLALRESEARFRALADNMSQLAWMADETGARFWFNHRWTEYTGTELQDVRDWRWTTVHPTSDREAVAAVCRERFALGRAWTDTYQLLGRDGNARWFLTQVVPLRSDAGAVIRWFGTHTDITAERDAQRAHERGRFFELSLDLVCITNTEGVFLHLSPSFSSVLGYPLPALLDHSILDFVHPDDRAETQCSLLHLPDGTATHAFTHRFRCADGSYRWLQWRWAPSPGGMNYAIARDVTSDREILETLRLTERDLRDKQASLTSSLREREVLLQEIHHRVKNNLQVISSLINMQARRLTAPSARSALIECKTRVEAIALIHEQLYQSKDYQCISFEEYLRGLTRNVARVAGTATHHVKVTIDSKPVVLPVDKAVPFGLILHELITNAFKHAFPDERSGEIKISLHESATGIELSVADDGVGMQVVAAQTTAARSLGMQLIETLVKQIGGQLSAIQANGTTFRITCPVERTHN